MPRQRKIAIFRLSARNNARSRTARGATSKTILIVDDDPTVLVVVSEMLANEYKILTAATGAHGLQQSREYKGEIHLLLSDFQMPGMSGVELGTIMTFERPRLRVLLMSAFAEGMLILNEGRHFLSNPLVASQLQALIVGLVSPDRKSKFSK